MGHIRENFGPFAVESYGDSFTIHSSYGYRPLRENVGDLSLGAHFKRLPEDDDDEVYYVTGQLIGGRTLAGRVAHPSSQDVEFNSSHVVNPVDEGGEPVDVEEDDHPLGRAWRDRPHPVFMNDDIGDLLRAIEDHQFKVS